MTATESDWAAPFLAIGRPKVWAFKDKVLAECPVHPGYTLTLFLNQHGRVGIRPSPYVSLSGDGFVRGVPLMGNIEKRSREPSDCACGFAGDHV
jgi:hypothetical protein